MSRTFSPLDVLSGELVRQDWTRLHQLPMAKAETTGYWADPGGTKADSNPGGIIRNHGVAHWEVNSNVTRFWFLPAIPPNADQAKHNDNCYMFTPLITSSMQQALSRLPNMPVFWMSGCVFQMNPQDIAAAIALEMDPQLRWGGEFFNRGIQFNIHDKQVKAFQYKVGGNGHWQTIPGIPLPDMSQKVSWVSLDEIRPGAVIRHGMFLNKKWFPIDMTMPTDTDPRHQAGFKLTRGIQLDSLHSDVGKQSPICGVNIYDMYEACLVPTASK